MNIVMKKMGDYLRDIHSRLVTPYKREAYIELERDIRRDKLNNPLRSIYVFFNPNVCGVVVFADVTEFVDPKDNIRKLHVKNFSDYPLRRTASDTSELVYVIDPTSDRAQDAIVKDAHHTYKSLINLLYKGVIHGETPPEAQPDIGIIYARDVNGVIGINGKLPWHCEEDLKHFKATTAGQTVVMGRKTWESLPGPLTGRLNVVLSKSILNLKEYDDPKTPVIQIHTIQDIFTLPRFKWIIGGEKLYTEMLPYASKISETIIDLHVDIAVFADAAWSPVIDGDIWEYKSGKYTPGSPGLLIGSYERVEK